MTTSDGPTNEAGLTLNQWMAEVDRHVQRETDGLVSIHDLGDFYSYDEWREGCDPLDSALMLLEEEGVPTIHEEQAPEWCAPLRPSPTQPTNQQITAALQDGRRERLF